MNKEHCTYCDKVIMLPKLHESNDHWYWQKNASRKNEGYHICNIKRSSYQKEYRQSVDGWARITYHTQRKNSRQRNHSMPDYSLDQFKEWAFSQSNFDILYSGWVSNDFDSDKRPSADRLDDYKPYTLENLRLVTYLENRLAGVNSKKAKEAYEIVNSRQGISVSKYTKDNVFTSEYKSAHQAGRETGIDPSSITKCCKGKYQTAGGFKWAYTQVP